MAYVRLVEELVRASRPWQTEFGPEAPEISRQPGAEEIDAIAKLSGPTKTGTRWDS